MLGALETNNVAVLYIGNILSFISSYVVAKLCGLEPMGQYFKPFTSYSLIVAISVFVFIVHTIIVLIYRVIRIAYKNLLTGSFNL